MSSTVYLTLTTKEQSIASNNSIQFNGENKRVDYKNKVCKKPWGYEFLVYESNKIGIWFLNIKKGHSTSLHCHFKKDTLIVVLSGCAKISLIDDEVICLNVLSSIYIPKNKIHALSTFSDEVFLMEIEIFDTDVTFSDKNDLLRINDQYQRDNKGYEQSIQTICNNLDQYGYFYITENFKKCVQGVDVQLTSMSNDTSNLHVANSINILLDGKIYDKGKHLCEGSIVNGIDVTRASNDCKILSIRKNYADEEQKIIYSLEHLEHIKKTLKGKKIVLTSGCFDILHVGHLHNLKTAKLYGDVLIVCLSNDQQIKKLKGENRPINDSHDRLNLFKTISYVDYVMLYDETNIEKEETLGSIMKKIDPDYWIKGTDYKKEDILKKHPYLRNIVLIDNISGKSTTNIVHRIQST